MIFCSDYNLVQHNSNQGVLSHLILAAGNKLQLLNGVLGDISSLPKKVHSGAIYDNTR